MQPISIVTHPGGAHKDDFLACAVLLASFPVIIERRNPEADDLANSQTYVIDIGGEYSEDLKNFDHHQFPRDQTPTCSLSLILKHLGLYEDAREFCDWLEVTEWFDCRGPINTADWLGVDREALSKLNSPLDATILRRFAKQTRHSPGEPIWEVMRMIGADLVGYITGLRARLDFVEKHAEVWLIEVNHETSFKALYMPKTDPMPAEPSFGLGQYINQAGLADAITAMVYPDSRNEGFGIRRFNDDTSVDFTQINGEPDIHFTHKQGFIAKTSSTATNRLKELLAMSYKS